MRVGVVGFGPIGREVARAVAGRPAARRGLELGAVIDAAESLAGRPVGELLEMPGLGDLVVERSLDKVLDKTEGQRLDAVALCTGSRIQSIATDVARLVAAKVHVVSTCEELAWPAESPEIAALDSAARRARVTVVGTGVNPGFVMDRLVLELASVCVRVERIEVERVLDVTARREPLRRKVGEGLTPEEFRAGVTAGKLGHVGLRASAALIAQGLGTGLAQTEETIEPVVGGDGLVLGLRQKLVAVTVDERPIELTLQMSVGAPDPHDRVVVTGDPPVDALIAGGTHGDRATVGAVVDALARLGRAPRGLITVVDLY